MLNICSVVSTSPSSRVTTAFSATAKPRKRLELFAGSGKMASARMKPTALSNIQWAG